MAVPIKARTPVNEGPESEMPLPVFGAIGVLSAAGPGVFSPATALNLFGFQPGRGRPLECWR